MTCRGPRRRGGGGGASQVPRGRKVLNKPCSAMYVYKCIYAYIWSTTIISQGFIAPFSTKKKKMGFMIKKKDGGFYFNSLLLRLRGFTFFILLFWVGNI